MQTPSQIVLDSYSIGGRFNSDCTICSKKIVYQQSSALCNCPIFFHPRCFVSQVNKRNLSQKPTLKCLYCQEIFHVAYIARGQMKCKPGIDKKQINLITISLISLAVAIVLGIKCLQTFNNQSIGESTETIYMMIGMVLLLVCFVVTFIMFLFSFFVSKDNIISNVKQKDRSIEFSAFKDIGISQENSNCMILQ